MTQVRVLGSVDVVDAEGSPVEIGGPRQRRLAAALAIARGESVSVDRLVEVVWPDERGLPEEPRNAVQTYVSRLRAAGLTIQRVGDGYALADAELDAAEFEAAVFEAGRLRELGDIGPSAERLETALDAWRGPAMGDYADESWARSSAVRYEEMRLRARERLLELQIESGEPAAAIGPLRELAAEQPFREHPHRLLMLALHLSGDQALALREFQRYRTRITTEAGLDPSEEIVALEQRIVAGDPALGAPSVRRIGSYELGDLIGEGAFGAIYKASQPSVGRDVAIKVVRRELANDAAFVRRFEVEARTVAHLEHPHIVPLYDFWRDPSGAYLVMRYLAGGSAEERLVRDGAWTLDSVARVVEEIGGALAVAHANGVVHRDVKPANVLFDEASHSYLTDFGIATGTSSSSELDLVSAGSPLYAAPEQVRDGVATPLSDQYAFGIVLYELLTGVVPFAGSASVDDLLTRKLREPLAAIGDLRPDVPNSVNRVVQTATQVEPGVRFADMGELVLAFRAAAGGHLADALSTTGSQPARPRQDASRTLIAMEMEAANPYKGLAAFDEPDANRFFGRDELAAEMVGHLHSSRFLVVAGPSGSGKSSLVRAGVVPKLRSAGSYVVTLTPGRHPFEALEAALLRIATTETGAMLEQLRGGRRGVVRAGRSVLPTDEAELVIVIDQFEELFTLSSEDEAAEFLEGVAEAVTDDGSSIKVVATLRADFYDRPLRHPSIADLVRVNTVAVTPLSGPELEEAITRPAGMVGVVVEPALVAAIVDEVSGQAASLPLTQYALAELYEQRTAGRMTLAAYEQIGGVAGALAQRAEDVFEALTPDGQHSARRLFARLVSPGDGTADTRRRALQSELVGVSPAVLDAFAAARLLGFDHDEASREPTVEVAHEALLREWPRLREWLDEDRDALRVLRHLTLAAEGWVVSGWAPEELYRGGRLEATEEMAATRAADLTETEAAFLTASIDERDRIASSERRRLRRLRTLLGATATVAAIAVFAGLLALQQRGRATDQRNLAEEQAAAAAAAAEEADIQSERATEAAAAEAGQRQRAERSEANAQEVARTADLRRMVAESSNLIGEDRRVAMLMAVEAHRRQEDAASLGALQRALVQTPEGWLGFLNGTEPYRYMEFVDGERLLGAGRNALEMWDLGERQLLWSRAMDGGIAAMATSGGQAVVASIGGDLFLVDLEKGENHLLASLGEEVPTVAMGPNGSLVAAGLASGAVMLFDRQGALVQEIQTGLGSILSVDLHPDQQWLLASSGVFGSARAFSYATGGPIGPELTIGNGALVGADVAAWHAEGVVIASFSAAAVFDPRTGAVVHEIPTANTFAGLGRFDGHGGSVALLGAAGLVEIVAASGSDVVAVPLDDQHGRTEALAWSHSLSLVAVSGNRGVSLASTSGQGLISRRQDHGDSVEIRISDDGATLAVGGAVVPTISFYDLDGTELSLVETTDRFGAVREHDGTFYMVGPPVDGRFQHGLWRDGDVEDMTAQFPYPPAAAMEFDHGRGRRFLTAGVDGVLVADVDTGEAVTTLDVVTPHVDLLDDPRRYVTDLEFTPSGDQLVAAVRSGHVYRFDAASLRQLGDPLEPEVGFHGIDFTSDGKWAVTSNWDTGVTSMRDGQSLEIVEGPHPVSGALGYGGDSPDVLQGDRYAIVGGRPGGATMWDLRTFEQVGGAFPHVTDQRSPAVASEANLMATTVPGGFVFWDLDVDTWPAIACRAAGRNMTSAEWARFGPQGEDYRATCEQWPALG